MRTIINKQVSFGEIVVIETNEPGADAPTIDAQNTDTRRHVEFGGVRTLRKPLANEHVKKASRAAQRIANSLAKMLST